MILEQGQWLGRGSVLAEGQSRGLPVACQLDIEIDDTGATLSGLWQAEGEPERDFQIRLAANEVGTYTLRVAVAGVRLEGTAKLESPPNLGLVWSEGGFLNATFALFSISRGFGFRGFIRDTVDAAAAGGGRVFTWEVAFSLKQEVLKGDNVVSLRRRR